MRARGFVPGLRFLKEKDEKMAIERTFSMIKPDATKRNLTGAITKKFEDAGLRVVASKRVWMSLREAEAYPGPSLIIAYSHCIAHGINMEHGLRQQKRAVASGHWPLIRYNPLVRESGGVPFTLDSLRPTLSLVDYRKHEGRFKQLARENPEEAERLARIAEDFARLRWDVYEKMASRSASEFHADPRRE